MIDENDLKRDEFASLMVAEFDARRRGAGSVAVVACPERVERQEKAIELVVRDGDGGLVAVEHTRMQSFLEQTSEAFALRKLFPFGGPELDGVSDATDFCLVVRIGQLLAVPRSRRKRVCAEITEWTRANLRLAPWPHVPGQSIVFEGRTPSGFELAVERRALSAHAALRSPRPIVQIIFWRPEDMEGRRAASLQVSLDAKVPKLLAASPGARTILVLENRDFATSAPKFVADALAGLEAPALPDAIYEFDVAHGNPLLSGILVDGVWWEGLTVRSETFPEARYLRFNSLLER